jgi:hypothetical protein
MAVDSSLLNNLYNRLGVSSTEVEPTPVPEDPSIAEQAYGKFEKLPIGAQIVAGVAPGTGHAIAAYETPMFAGETKEALKEGNIPRMLGMGAMTGLSALGMIPGLGIPIRGAKAGIKAATKILDDKVFTNIPKVNETIARQKISKITDEDVKKWEKINQPDLTDTKRYKEVQGENLENLQEAVRARVNRDISQEEYNDLVNNYKPITSFSKQDYRNMIDKKRIPEKEEIPKALRKDQRTKIKNKKAGVLYDTTEIKDGEIIDSRLDIPAYESFNKWITTLSRGKEKIYGQTAYLTDVTFIPTTKAAVKVGTGQRNTKGNLIGKSPFAVMKGGWKNHNPDTLITKVEDLIDNPEWVQIGYDPRRHGHFYTRGKFNQVDELTGRPITIAKETPIESASEVIQIGPLVLAKNPVFGDTMVYKEGGSIVERNPYTHNMKAI